MSEGGKKDKRPTLCIQIRDEDACVEDGAKEGDCAWCEGKLWPASCISGKVGRVRCKREGAAESMDDGHSSAEEEPVMSFLLQRIFYVHLWLRNLGLCCTWRSQH